MKKKETIIIISLTLIIILLILLNITTNEKLQQNKNKCLTTTEIKENTTETKKETTETKEKLKDKEIYDFIDKIKGTWASCTMTEYGCAGFVYSITDESITWYKLQSDGGDTIYITSIEKENNFYKINTVSPAKLSYGHMNAQTEATYNSIYINIEDIDNKIIKIIKYYENKETSTYNLEYAGKNVEEVKEFFKNKGETNTDYLKNWVKEN